MREVAVRPLTGESIGALADLGPHLSPHLSQPTCADNLRSALSDPSTQILVAWIGDMVAGTVTLVVSQTMSGVKAVIHDLVVQPRLRRQGAGRALIAQAIARAREAGAASVELTSSRKRDEAQALYGSLGFEQRETHVFRRPT